MMCDDNFRLTAGADPRPFLKWVGGKRQLLKDLVRLLPKTFGRYYEQFVGGGALFFHLLPAHAILSDVNADLVNAYVVVRDYTNSLIAHLYGLQGEYLELSMDGREAMYYRIRADADQRLRSAVGRAARMIFINKTGFNGLYRVNRSGKINVPFGKHKCPAICDTDNLRACARALKRSDILLASFEDTMARAVSGDLVYCDPPYVPAGPTADFTAYAKDGFGMAAQEALAAAVERLTARGIHVMLSNADVPWVRERYAAFHVHGVTARRAVNCKGSKRGPVGEVIVTNYEPGAGAPAEEVRSDEG